MSLRVENTAPVATVAASLGRDLAEFAATKSLDLTTFLRPYGLHLDEFQSFDARVDLASFCRLLDALAMANQSDSFGLDYADFFRRGGSGAFGQGLAAAPTLKDVLLFYTKYIHTVVDHRSFETTFERKHTTIEWTYSPLVTHVDHFIDFAVKLVADLLMRISGGRATFVSFALQRGRPRSLDNHSAAFPGILRFGQTTNKVVMASDFLRLENPHADPVLYEYMRQQCDKALAVRRSAKPLEHSLKEDILERLPSGGLPISRAAERHGMSVRTLQRRLEQAGLTFEAIVDDVRTDLIVAKLRDASISLSQVAAMAGYSDPSSFSRAVVSRFGDTPSVLRKKLVSGQKNEMF